GPAGDALGKQIGGAIELLTIGGGPRGGLSASCWWTPEEIHRAWPNWFDATPGHLPMFLMVRIARLIGNSVDELTRSRATLLIPTGSGETITCLRWAFP